MSCPFHLLVSRSGFYHGRFLLVLSRQSLLLRELSSMHQMSRSLRESYRILQLPDEAQSSPGQVKEAYLRLAKLYHPDSGAPTADAMLFARVEEAYRAVLGHKTNRTDGGKQVEDEDNSRDMLDCHQVLLAKQY
ncbi:dnaJ homolog subfamily C member 28 [Gymnodraco acuticeps]|uniref:DnaJ homolog subfamily C member 28 n=1 Tax=Gymnodraco acuticeps TaxID=8218 RepID=A0A6P8T182_GYMAC|nr:dnaJ homolog subfamily C member 28 [Gymnodraco acuticeps]